jgi:hypothetical protein
LFIREESNKKRRRTWAKKGSGKYKMRVREKKFYGY